MATRYIKILLAAAPLTLPTILMGMQPTAQTASMQVIQSAPHMRVVSEAIPVQPEGKEAAQQRSHFEEKDNEDLFKTIDKLNTQMASYISSQATKTTTVTEKNDDLTEDWQHIDRQELLAELAKLKAENKRLLDENGRSMLSRLKDMIAGATILTATELGLFYALYHKEIWYVCENYKEFEVLWTTICKLIYGT